VVISDPALTKFRKNMVGTPNIRIPRVIENDLFHRETSINEIFLWILKRPSTLAGQVFEADP